MGLPVNQSGTSLDVILRFIQDEEANRRVQKGLTTVEDELAQIEKAAGSANNAMEAGNKKVVASTEAVTKATKGVEKAVKDEGRTALDIMNKEAAALNRLAALRAKEIGDLKERADFLERASTPIFAAGLAGITAITVAAKNYIDNTEETNEITEKWAANSERVENAQLKIGKVAAEAILPLYTQLADIVDKASDFIEKNPGILEAGLKASIVAAGLGGIGILAAKGIKLYADIKMIAVGDMQLLAAKIMSDAANKQLLAAKGGALPGVAGKVIPGGATVAGAAGGLPVTAAIAAVASSALLIFSLSASLAKLVENLTGVRLPILSFIDYLGKLTGAVDKSTEVQKNAGIAAAQATETLINETEEQNKVKAAQAALDEKLQQDKLSKEREARAQSLRDTQESLDLERQQKRAYFIEQFKDMVSQLQIEKQLKNEAFQGFLADVNSFVDSLKNIFASLSGSSSSSTQNVGGASSNFSNFKPFGSRAQGGYTPYGLYMMGDSPGGGRGMTEYVIKGQTVKALEGMIGGRISDQALLQGSQTINNGRSVLYNDFRRINNMGTQDRRDSRRDTLEVITTALEKAGKRGYR